MKLLRNILAIFSALIILICSVAQFHHHDVTGKIVVFSCSEQLCCETHNQEISHTIKNHQCSHGCSDKNHQDEKNCSLKINLAKVENKSFFPIISIFEIFDYEIKNLLQLENHFNIPQIVSKLCSGNYNIYLLRAPPVV